MLWGSEAEKIISNMLGEELSLGLNTELIRLMSAAFERNVDCVEWDERRFGLAVGSAIVGV